MTMRKAARPGPVPEPAVRAAAHLPDLPSWVPEAARNYLAHTEGGRTIRALAREARVAPSTILRRVRRVESSRDDPLVDAALRQLSVRPAPEVKAEAAGAGAPGGRSALAEEAMPVLRRLSEPGTVLAVARDMEKGVIVREAAEGDPQRLAVVDRQFAEAMALREWIACPGPEARVSRYRVTPQGRAVLRTLIAEAAGRGLALARAGLDAPRDEEEDTRLRHMRSAMAESPLAALARRRTGQGAPFLSRELVTAGERLREDFEVAQRAAGGAPDWDAELARLLAGAEPPGPKAGPAAAARSRVLGALAALGPGLAEVCLRCCCRLEGLEAVEARLGWSARSGKIVLRIALQRLARHYGEGSRFGPLIG